MKQDFFTYRGRPLVRCGKQIYYGSMADPFVCLIEVRSEKENPAGQMLADNLKIYLMSTRERNPVKAIVKQAERKTLYEAVDVACAWLEKGQSAKDGAKKDTGRGRKQA